MPFVRRVRRLFVRVDDAGQTTAEYALVILGAAVVAGALAVWAKGGAIKQLFDDVIGKIL
jgi:Flp pilus assembly pilin Flp